MMIKPVEKKLILDKNLCYFELGEKETLKLNVSSLQRITFIPKCTIEDINNEVINMNIVDFFNIIEKIEGATTIYSLPDESYTVIFRGPGIIFKSLD